MVKTSQTEKILYFPWFVYCERVTNTLPSNSKVNYDIRDQNVTNFTWCMELISENFTGKFY